jgi:hypothetical protein
VTTEDKTGKRRRKKRRRRDLLTPEELERRKLRAADVHE